MKRRNLIYDKFLLDDTVYICPENILYQLIIIYKHEREYIIGRIYRFKTSL